METVSTKYANVLKPGSHTIQCEICACQNLVKAAVKWCGECDETFCTNCLKHHNVAKATRRHRVVDVKKYEKIPDVVLNIKKICETHDEPFQIYCSTHDCLCCIRCLNIIHSACVNLKTLDEAVRHPISSVFESLEELNVRLQNLKLFYCDITKEQTEFIEELKTNRKHIEDEIVTYRGQINKVLDTLEGQIHRNLDEMEKEMQNRNEDLSKIIENNQKRTNSLLDAIPVIREHSSNLHIFLGTKEIEAEVEKEEDIVEELRNDEKLIYYSPKFSTENKIVNFLKDVKSLGEVIKLSKESQVIFRKANRAQIVASSPTTIKLKLVKTLTINVGSNSTIANCAVLPGRQALFLIISSYASPNDADPKDAKLVILNETGNEVSSIDVSSWCFDMAYINENTVAISSSSETKIVFVNLETKKEEKSIRTSHVCYGIAYDDDRLYSCGIHGFERRRMCTNRVTKLNIESGNPNGFLPYERFALYSDSIIATNNREDTVTCYDMSGSVKWTWNNPEVLNGLSGIAVDASGDVYVTGRDSHNVVVISEGGKRFEQLTDEHIRYPGAIYFDDSNYELLVCGEQGGAVLYSVEK